MMHDVSAATTYDVLHDAVYRKKWDHTMVSGYELCKINLTNDISYYQSEFPTLGLFSSSWEFELCYVTHLAAGSADLTY